MSPYRFSDPSRAWLTLRGEEVRAFLQDLVTNDLNRLAPDRGLYAGLLSPQGKLLADFLIVETEDAIALEVAAGQAAALLLRLQMYRLRRKLEITRAPIGDLHCVFGADTAGIADLPQGRGACTMLGGVRVLADPRDSRLGYRMYGPETAIGTIVPGLVAATREDWDAHRISLGVPEGDADLTPDRSFPLEAGFEALDGVDFRKGCYVGQEVTARMHHKAVLRRGLRRLRVPDPAPAPGTPILADGKPAGTLLSSARGIALAQLRLDRAAGAKLEAEGIQLEVLD